jgi:NAD(P)-dependent dehydrogenase (short-subunit alcohol dehydrogenase family)
MRYRLPEESRKTPRARAAFGCGVMRLLNKVALVTGGGRGIGRAIALAFAREGADVAVNAAHKETAEAVANEIKSMGRKSIAVKADVSNCKESPTNG